MSSEGDMYVVWLHLHLIFTIRNIWRNTRGKWLVFYRSCKLLNGTVGSEFHIVPSANGCQLLNLKRSWPSQVVRGSCILVPVVMWGYALGRCHWDGRIHVFETQKRSHGCSIIPAVSNMHFFHHDIEPQHIIVTGFSYVPCSGLRQEGFTISKVTPLPIWDYLFGE